MSSRAGRLVAAVMDEYYRTLYAESWTPCALCDIPECMHMDFAEEIDHAFVHPHVMAAILTRGTVSFGGYKRLQWRATTHA